MSDSPGGQIPRLARPLRVPTSTQKVRRADPTPVPAPAVLTPDPSRRPARRFAKLLLRLPALRSIGLKCLEHLFFFKLIGDTPIDTFLMEMLEAPLQVT